MDGYVAIYDSNFHRLFQRESFANFKLAETSQSIATMRLSYDKTGNTERIFMAGQSMNDASVATLTLPFEGIAGFIKIEADANHDFDGGVTATATKVTHVFHSDYSSSKYTSSLFGALSKHAVSPHLAPKVGFWSAELNYEGVINSNNGAISVTILNDDAVSILSLIPA